MGIKKFQIEEEWRDSDGYHIALRAGWKDDSDPLGACHTIGEDTKREAYRHEAIVCSCDDDCRKASARRNKMIAAAQF